MRMTLLELVRKSDEPDFLGELLALTVQRLATSASAR